jgi:hypothetical protein
MQVTDRGELIYDFGSLVRRGNKTLKEQMDEIGKLLWKGFTYFFKVWIMLMLVGYFVVFVVLLLVIAIGSMFAGDRDEGISLDSGISTLLLRVLAEFFFWKTITGNLTYRNDRHGYRYRQANHAAKCFTEGHLLISKPVSDMIAKSTLSLKPLTFEKSTPVIRYIISVALNSI